MKKGGDGLDGATTLELLSERVFGQCYASLFLVVVQGSLKEHAKMRGPRMVTHVEEFVVCERELTVGCGGRRLRRMRVRVRVRVGARFSLFDTVSHTFTTVATD